ncbi:MAG: mercury resistance system transport protein MerF [Chloroflexota bacterium]
MTRLKKFGIAGAIISALLCVTPALVMLFGALGVGWLSGYIDYIVVPVLLLFVGITGYAYLASNRAKSSKLVE